MFCASFSFWKNLQFVFYFLFFSFIYNFLVLVIIVTSVFHFHFVWFKHFITCLCSIVWLCGVAVQCWTCDQLVAGSNPSHPAVEYNPGQVVSTRASVTKQYNLVRANGRWCLAARKVTVGLVSHWLRVTDISGSPPTGSRPRRGRSAPTYAVLWSMGDFTFT